MHSKRSSMGSEGLGASAILVMILASPASGQDGLRHFQCYVIKPKAFSAIAGVSVVDQFGPLYRLRHASAV